VPFYSDLATYKCEQNKIVWDLRDIAEKAKLFDSLSSNAVRILPLGGAVFHESRVGSTMVSNLLTTLGRVYSEPGPIYTAFSACTSRDGQLIPDCDTKKQQRLLQDVFYMMQRSNTQQSNPPRRVFFKFGSRLTAHIAKFTELFPHTPWIFLYRDPIEVLVSHQKKAACFSKTYLPEDIKKDIGSRGADGKSVWDKHDIQFCAAQLAGICESALQHIHHNGRLVNHRQLPTEL
jgi:hypothetical protein